MQVNYATHGYNVKESYLEMVGELDRPNLSYEFESLGVFQSKKSGKLWWATTSGCSCPSPYEEYNYEPETEESDMNVLNKETFNEFERAAMGFCSDVDYGYRESIPLDERKSFVESIRKILYA